MAVELYNYPTFFNHANLVHYWRLEGNSNDAKGSNNGTDANITYSTGNGKYNQGAGLNGSSSKITFSNPSIGAAFTIMMWVKPTGNWASTAQGLFDTLPSGVGAVVLKGASGTALNYVIGGVGTATTSAIGDITGAWHHFAVVGSGSNTLKVIMDGVEIGSNTFGGNFGSNTFLIGNFNAGNWFDGAVDDVAYFSTNIATADILAYYNFVQGGGSPMLFGGGVTIG